MSAPYRIAISHSEHNKLTEWENWADEKNLRSEYIARLKELEFRLGYEPSEWGESRETLPNLDLQVRIGTCRMITVLYGVHEEKKTVFVKQFHLNANYKPTEG
jgi:hypothetical protein